MKLCLKNIVKSRGTIGNIGQWECPGFNPLNRPLPQKKGKRRKRKREEEHLAKPIRAMGSTQDFCGSPGKRHSLSCMFAECNPETIVAKVLLYEQGTPDCSQQWKEKLLVLISSESIGGSKPLIAGIRNALYWWMLWFAQTHLQDLLFYFSHFQVRRSGIWWLRRAAQP